LSKNDLREQINYSIILSKGIRPTYIQMFDELKKYCKTIITFTEEEVALIDNYFEVKTLKKKDFLLPKEQ